MKRRKFIKNSLILTAGTQLSTLSNVWAAPLSPLWEVSDASSVNTLNIQSTSHQVADSLPATRIWSFAKNSFAPAIIATQNQPLKIIANNQLPGEKVAVHWHGIRLPNNMDGVPGLTQPPIKYKEKFTYQYTPPDAGTYWYHTHSNSIEQLGRGLVGPLIVKEQEEYPVDQDLIVFVKDFRFAKDAQIVDNFSNFHNMAHEGNIGNVVTVNGQLRPTLSLKPNSRVRLRFINASNARIIQPVFPEEMKATIIAWDGNPIDPVAHFKIPLAPGNRFDVVVDIPESSKEVFVQDDYYRNYQMFGIQSLGKKVRSKLLGEVKKLPDNPQPKLDLNKTWDLDLVLEGGAMSGMMGMFSSGGIWQLNGMSMEKDKMGAGKPIFNMKMGVVYKIKITNATALQHPMHFHGHSFQVLSKMPSRPKAPYWSDTVLIPPKGETTIALKADNPGKWMIHCHIIEHQDSGMMATFNVA